MSGRKPLQLRLAQPLAGLVMLLVDVAYALPGATLVTAYRPIDPAHLWRRVVA